MGTKDWTDTALVECLSDNLPLSGEQRAILITLVVQRHKQDRDADRYRFVRTADKVGISAEAARDPVAYDAAIDAAMARQMELGA